MINSMAEGLKTGPTECGTTESTSRGRNMGKTILMGKEFMFCPKSAFKKVCGRITTCRQGVV